MSDITHLFSPAFSGLNGWRLFRSQVPSEHQPHTKPCQALAREANTPLLHRASRGDRQRTQNQELGRRLDPRGGWPTSAPLPLVVA